MAKIVLKADKRTVLGKKVKKLRREGLLPLNLYGKDIKSLALTSNFKDFNKVYKTAKMTQVVYLEVGKDEHPALIQNIQIHPTLRQILHADLKKIDLKQKTEVEVPVEVVGELAVVKSGEADVIILHSNILVECLPTKIPEKIVVDISKLEGIGSEVRVKDLPKSADYAYKLEEDMVVLQVSAAQKEEIPVPVAEVALVEGETPPEGAAAGPAEGVAAPDAKTKPDEKK